MSSDPEHVFLHTTGGSITQWIATVFMSFGTGSEWHGEVIIVGVGDNMGILPCDGFRERGFE